MRDVTDDPADASTVDDTYERLFVGGVFVFMAVALFVYVWKFGRNIPFWDDWELVPVLTGHEPFSLTWLWTPHNEHTIPIVRLVMFVVWRLTGDLRVVMFLTSALLCAGVGGLAITVRRLRGHTSFSDAVFPLALLGWGLFENHIFAMQFFFVCAALLTVAAVSIGLGDTRNQGLRASSMAACLVALPLFGAIGLALFPCLLAWFAYSGVRAVRSEGGRNRRVGVILLAGCGVAIAAAAISVYLLPPVTTITPRASLFTMLQTGSEMLSTSIGQAGQKLYPLSAGGTIGAVLIAVAFACRTAWKEPERRSASLLLLAGIGSLLMLVAAIAFGRAGMSTGQGFSNRYALFSATLLCICYLCFSIYATGGLGRFLRTGVLLALTAGFATNAWAGIVYGIDRADRADSLTEAIDAGAPPDVAAARHAERLYPIPAVLAERLEMLRIAKAGPYARPQAFPGDSPCREVAVPVSRLGEHEMFFDDGVFQGVGSDPFVVYALAKPSYVCGVRLTFTLTNPSMVAPVMQVFWADSAHSEIQEGRRSSAVPIDRSTAVQERIVWIYGNVDRLRIDPDQQPCTFDLREITFLVRDVSQ